MKVKIKKCSNPFSWYTDKVGQIFEVQPYNLRKYQCVDNPIRFVLISDVAFLPEYEQGKVAPPEERYNMACLGCGSREDLHMLPLNTGGLIVGWFFACSGCYADLAGKQFGMIGG